MSSPNRSKSGSPFPATAGERPRCIGPVTYTGHDATAADIAHFRAGLGPASATRVANDYYATDEEFVWACAEAMRDSTCAGAVGTGPHHRHRDARHRRDPDGTGIEVLYDLPPEVWEGNVDAALNFFEFLPNTGDEALDDPTDYRRFSASKST